MSTDISNSTDSSEARGKDRAWHTTRGEDNSKERMKQQRRNKERGMKEAQQRRMITVRSVK